VAWTEDDPREGKWTYQQVVLHEPFHLSYPFGTCPPISILFIYFFILYLYFYCKLFVYLCSRVFSFGWL
jgi:hypothetical protein